MAVAMLLLLPTFNALNNSYVQNVQPPPWIPTPKEIPPDFVPPTPPPDFVPPEDMELPPGWEPPPGYEGPIPPGGCPPPIIVPIEAWNKTGTFDATRQSFSQEWEARLPRHTYAFGGYVNFTDWQASRVWFELEQGEDDVASEERVGNAGLLFATQPVDETSFSFDSRDSELGEFPPEGPYTLRLGVDVPLQGAYKSEFVAAIPCGGLLE